MLRAVILLLSLLAASLPALAQEAPATAQICAACHGQAGVPISPLIPIIWGQNEGYLYLQLRDMKRGDRQVTAMAAIVATFDKQQMLDLAAYFAAKPWPAMPQPSASDADAHRAEADNISVGCTGCHLSGYLAAGSVPRLADQRPAYLAKTMEDFRTGARANNPGMSALMVATGEQDYAAIAAYLAGL